MPSLDSGPALQPVPLLPEAPLLPPAVGMSRSRPKPALDGRRFGTDAQCEKEGRGSAGILVFSCSDSGSSLWDSRKRLGLAHCSALTFASHSATFRSCFFVEAPPREDDGDEVVDIFNPDKSAEFKILEVARAYLALSNHLTNSYYGRLSAHPAREANRTHGIACKS